MGMARRRDTLHAAGAEALDKKQRKQFDAWQLQNVKAAPLKPGRVSAAIGKGWSHHTVQPFMLCDGCMI